MTTTLLILAGICLCVLLSGFFSGSEMAFSSCSSLRLEHLRDDGSKPAGVAAKIAARFEDALGAILIGNNLVNIAASSLITVLVVHLTGSTEKVWLGTLIITVLIIIFGETIPKITCKKNANRVAVRYAYPVQALMWLLKPLVWLVVKTIELITKPLKGEEDEDDEEAVEELQNLIETAEDEDVLDEDQSELVQAAIEFDQISASEVMTARVDVYAIDIEDDWDEILRLVEESPYSRLPVYEGSIDNIIGVLYLNHFLKAMTEDGHTDIRSHLMPPCFVYKTMKLPAVLNELKKARQHLAIVSDEYGGTLGDLSMEDVLEQIVGDIWDDTDTVEQEVVRRSESEYELDGDMLIGDMLELLGIDEDAFEAESETVGGWTVESFGAFPEVGDSFRYENWRVTVLAMDGRRVEKVLVKAEADESGAEAKE